jgi:hypothetical protein
MDSLSKLAYRALGTALVVVAIVAQAMLMYRAGGGLGRLQPSFLPVVGMGVVDSVVAGLLALALAYGTDGARGTHALALCLAAWSYVLAYSGVVALFPAAAGDLARTIFQAHFPLVEMLGLAGALRFSAEFPETISRSDLAPPESLRLGLRTLQRMRIALIEPSAPWIAAVVAFAALLAVNAWAGGLLQEAPLNPFAALVRFAALTAVVLNFRVSWIRARGKAHGRMLWLVVGLALLFAFLGVLIGGNVLMDVTGWRIPLVRWRPIVLDLSLLSLLWGMTMAVYYGGPVDPARLAGRTAVLGGAITAGLFLAAGLEALFSDVLVARMTLPRGLGTFLAIVLTTLAYRRARPGLEGTLAVIWTSNGQRVA